MIVHRHRKRLFGGVLPNHILIKSFANLCRLGDSDVRGLTTGILIELFIQNAFANIDAAVANINSRTGDEFSHFRVAFATEGAHGEV